MSLGQRMWRTCPGLPRTDEGESIKSYGVHIPRYRLGRETTGEGGSTERAIANFDEDSVTMAVAAGLDCLQGRDRQAIDALFFASSTVPYAEKQGAAIISAALDLRRDIFAADVTDVLRAGTTALRSALDAVADTLSSAVDLDALFGAARRPNALTLSVPVRYG